MAKKKSTIVNAKFVSIWDKDKEFPISCKVNLKTNEVLNIDVPYERAGCVNLDEEYLVLDNKKYPVECLCDSSDASTRTAPFWYVA
jgi:hypothetical protein